MPAGRAAVASDMSGAELPSQRGDLLQLRPVNSGDNELRRQVGVSRAALDVVRSQAPLRISFCGGGTDVPPYPERFGGCVLSCTIDKYAYVSLRTIDDPIVRVHSRDLNRVLEFSHETSPAAERPDLAESIIRRFSEQHLECYMHSDVPPGSGLGSSSAMIVALIAALATRNRLMLSPYDVAEAALTIERTDLQIEGGMQDQYAATFGGFNFMEFTKDGVVVNPLRIPQATLDELHYNLLLCFTGRTRLSSTILQEQTANVVNADDRVLSGLADLRELAIEMKNVLLTGRCRAFGELLNQAWKLKRTLASGITDARIDALYDDALDAGAIGGKLLGAGGGGYLLFFVPFTKRDRVRTRLEAAGGEVVDFQFESRGVRTWNTSSELWITD